MNIQVISKNQSPNFVVEVFTPGSDESIVSHTPAPNTFPPTTPTSTSGLTAPATTISIPAETTASPTLPLVISLTPTSDIEQLTFGAGDNVQPAFSPDGEEVLFISNRDGNAEIYLMNADGSNQLRLTNTPDFVEDLPSFSPDGSLIIFSRHDGHDWEIFIMNRAGDLVQNISRLPASNESRAKFFRGIFTSLNVIYDSDRTGNFELYWANFQVNNIINAKQITDRPDYDDRLPTFIPSLDKVLFRSEAASQNLSHINLINLDGTGLVQLTDFDAWYPVLSKDEEWVIFVSEEGNSDIYRMRLDASGMDNLTNHPDEDTTPVISPDGQYLVFASKRSGNNYHLFRKWIGSDLP